MAYRTFVDEKGVAWQAWDVYPAHVERRVTDRRTQNLPYDGADRRSGKERRRRYEARVSLGPQLAQGWLAFHCANEKRRYSPIPEGWYMYSAYELSRICRAAPVVCENTPTRDMRLFTSGEYRVADDTAQGITDAGARQDALDSADDASSDSAA